MKNSFFLFLILFGIVRSQIDYNINYELRLSIDEDGYESSSFRNFENYFDLNFYFDDLYLYSLLKYNNPPIIGSETKDIDDLIEVLFLDYSINDFDFSFGHIYQMYGSGLTMHTFNDRNIDYNNALFGINMSYYINDSWTIYGILGANEFESRTKLDIAEPDIFIGNKLGLAGITYSHDFFDLTYLSSINNQSIDSSTIYQMKSIPGSLFSQDLDFRINSDTGLEPEDYEMNNYEHNLVFNAFLGDLEVSFEKSLVYYNKIMSERVTGSKFYFSAYLDFYDYAILYEFKDYDTPYLFSVFSNPPTLFKEATSPLISRHTHAVDFSNERGHHLTVNKTFSDQFNFMGNISFAYKNPHDSNVEEANFSKFLKNIIKFENVSEFELLSPYRQLYLEFNGWNKSGKVFYKIGFDNYVEYFNLIGDLIDLPDKIIKAKTLPTQFSFKLNQGNSFSMYLEMQKLYQYISGEGIFNSVYFSPSYNHFGKWVVSLFCDLEKQVSEKDYNNYFGADFTYYLSETNTLSVFVGSQKGGLVCANGTCVYQPDFLNGVKFTARVLF